MQISELALEKIKAFEGCRLQAYQDAAEVWTIGYGHTKKVKPGDKISQYWADEYLKEDIEEVEAQIEAAAGRAGVVRVQHRHRQVQGVYLVALHP